MAGSSAWQGAARSGGECGQANGERLSRASTPPRVENVSVRRGSPSATRPPPAGRQGPGRGSAPRSASTISTATSTWPGRTQPCPTSMRPSAPRSASTSMCPKAGTYAPRRVGRRRASATAQNGAARGIATSGGTSRELHRARVDSLANPSVFPGARARTCACAALVWAHAPVRGRAREAPIAQPLHPSTCRTREASRRGATPTELGPAAGARARRRARHARERARRTDRARPRGARALTAEGRRRGRGRLARSRPRSHEKSAKIACFHPRYEWWNDAVLV